MYSVCRRARASFSPEILQAGAVKGLILGFTCENNHWANPRCSDRCRSANVACTESPGKFLTDRSVTKWINVAAVTTRTRTKRALINSRITTDIHAINIHSLTRWSPGFSKSRQHAYSVECRATKFGHVSHVSSDPLSLLSVSEMMSWQIAHSHNMFTVRPFNSSTVGDIIAWKND